MKSIFVRLIHVSLAFFIFVDAHVPTSRRSTSGRSLNSKNMFSSDTDDGEGIKKFPIDSYTHESIDYNKVKQDKGTRCKSIPITNVRIQKLRQEAEMKSRRRRNANTKYRWNKRDLTWRISKYTSDLQNNLTRWIINRAFSKWQAVTNLRFTEMSEEGEADIMISFVIGRHNCTVPFYPNSPNVGHFFYPKNESGLPGDIHFNDYKHFTYSDNNGYKLLLAAMHTIGHILGLVKHSENNTSIMYYPDNYALDYQLMPDDISRIQEIYGKPERVSESSKGFSDPTKTTKLWSQSQSEVKESLKSPQPARNPAKSNNGNKDKTLFIVAIVSSTVITTALIAVISFVCWRRCQFKSRRSFIISKESTSLTVRFKNSSALPNSDSVDRHGIEINTCSTTEINTFRTMNNKSPEPVSVPTAPIYTTISTAENALRKKSIKTKLPCPMEHMFIIGGHHWRCINTRTKNDGVCIGKLCTHIRKPEPPQHLPFLRMNSKQNEDCHTEPIRAVGVTCTGKNTNTREPSYLEPISAADNSFLSKRRTGGEPYYLDILPDELDCSSSMNTKQNEPPEHLPFLRMNTKQNEDCHTEHIVASDITCTRKNTNTREPSYLEPISTADNSFLPKISRERYSEREPYYFDILPDESDCNSSINSNQFKFTISSAQDINVESNSGECSNIIPGSSCRLFHQSNSEIDASVSRNFAQYVCINNDRSLYKVPSGIPKRQAPQTSPPPMGKLDLYGYVTAKSNGYYATVSPSVEGLITKKKKPADKSNYLN